MSLELARAVVEAGWEVIPVRLADHGAKVPLLRGWQEAGSRLAFEVGSWWERWPEALVGVVCGARQGLHVVDEDAPGAVEAAGLGPALLRLPSQPSRQPGRRHWHCGPPADELLVPTRVAMAPKVDVKGERSFVVAWHPLAPRGTLPALPAEVAERARRGARDPEARVRVLGGYSEALLAAALRVVTEAPEGERNARLFRMGCRLAEHRAPAEAYRRLGRAAVDVAGLEPKEVQDTLRSAWEQYHRK